MKKLDMFADVYSQWEYVVKEYGQNVENFPLRAILQNCHQKMAVEIISLELILNGGEPAVKLSTTNGEIIITSKNSWELANGQTNTKKTIFTQPIN
ncbi:MAG: hypothetical protein Q8P77_01460 [Candidatus Veblenbacteria bacterium]|nr:hypothetical protein [Candidatus Veblenbacteria bacterium]